MNPMMMLQFQEAWNLFKNRHPKFPLFLKAVSNDGLHEGSVIEVTVTAPDGKTYSSNLKLTKEDLEFIKQFRH